MQALFPVLCNINLFYLTYLKVVSSIILLSHVGKLSLGNNLHKVVLLGYGRAVFGTQITESRV